MNDPFFRGIIAGLIVGVVKDIPDFILHSMFHLKKLLFWDYAGVIAFNRMPAGFLETALAVLFEVMFSHGAWSFLYIAGRQSNQDQALSFIGPIIWQLGLVYCYGGN